MDRSCQQTRAPETQLTRGQVRSHPLKELPFAVAVGPDGGQITRVDVDCLADGRAMTLQPHGRMRACGTGISDPDAC